MPLNSKNIEDLNKEYNSYLFDLRLRQFDVLYHFGAYSDEEEQYDIKIYKLYLEYKQQLNLIKKTNSYNYKQKLRSYNAK